MYYVSLLSLDTDCLKCDMLRIGRGADLHFSLVEPMDMRVLKYINVANINAMTCILTLLSPTLMSMLLYLLITCQFPLLYRVSMMSKSYLQLSQVHFRAIIITEGSVTVHIGTLSSSSLMHRLSMMINHHHLLIPSQPRPHHYRRTGESALRHHLSMINPSPSSRNLIY
jgi:hypothetical protein